MNSEQISITFQSGDLWITLPDAINMDSSKIIESAIINNCNGSLGRIVFDFSRVNNLYSSGLGLIIRIRKLVLERGGSLCIVNVSGKIHEMFATFNLDRIFTLYTTDVEFKINNDDIWKSEKKSVIEEFLFIARVEDGFFRLNLSGEMTFSQDLACLQQFMPLPEIPLYIFDLTSLEKVDMSGAQIFQQLTLRITQSGGVCRVFGIEELLYQTLKLLGADRHVTFFKNEKDALTGKNTP
ncbi:MAG TPA: STAS domain-containing protein [Chitinispirillaceae bacterium]|nr:STAS domain-containing protein [Chitinispirillaceae bacterium]